MTFVVLTLVVLPELFSLPRVHLSQLLSALAGVALGWAIARASRRTGAFRNPNHGLRDGL